MFPPIREENAPLSKLCRDIYAGLFQFGMSILEREFHSHPLQNSGGKYNEFQPPFANDVCPSGVYARPARE